MKMKLTKKKDNLKKITQRDDKRPVQFRLCSFEL